MENILAVIANSGQEGIIISKITRKANLGHDPVKERCEKLKRAGLIQCVETKWKTSFLITEKGRMFLEEIQKFQNLVQSMDLEI